MKLWLIFLLVLFSSSSSFAVKNNNNKLLSSIYFLYAQASCEQLEYATTVLPKGSFDITLDKVKSESTSCNTKPKINSIYNYQIINNVDEQANVSVTLPLNGNKYNQLITLKKSIDNKYLLSIKTLNQTKIDMPSDDINNTDLIVKSIIYQWITELEKGTTLGNIVHLVDHNDFKFKFVDTFIDSNELLAIWLLHRKNSFESFYKLGHISTVEESEAKVIVNFEYEYEEIDNNNTKSIARIHTVWTFSVKEDYFKIKSIVEKYLPPKLGFISNIEC